MPSNDGKEKGRDKDLKEGVSYVVARTMQPVVLKLVSQGEAKEEKHFNDYFVGAGVSG